MRRVEELTRAELENVVRQIQSILYETTCVDADKQRHEVFSRDKTWDSETIEFVDRVLDDQGLSPDSVVPEIVEEGAVYWVDLPTVDCIQSEEDGWRNVGEFTDKASALAFIREHVGNCDDDGRISLLTNGQS